MRLRAKPRAAYQRCVCIRVHVTTTPAIRDMYRPILMALCRVILYYGLRGMQPTHTQTVTQIHIARPRVSLVLVSGK